MRGEDIYKNAFLVDELQRAATTMNRDQFVKFQVDSINCLGRNFHSDFLTVNILHLNDKFMLDGEITSAVAHTSQNTIDSYQRALIHDEFTPITFLHSGTALFNTSIRTMDEWIDHPIYTEHCTTYDLHWVLGISYRFPHHKTTFVAFDYIRAKGEPFSPDLTEEYVEYLSYPFYLAWLHIYGAICAETLKEWLTLCVGMTQPRFFVLRGIAGQGLTKAPMLADRFGLQPRTIHRHVENIFEQLLSREPELYKFEGNANRLTSIQQAYRFMEFGAGNASRVLPRRKFDG